MVAAAGTVTPPVVASSWLASMYTGSLVRLVKFRHAHNDVLAAIVRTRLLDCSRTPDQTSVWRQPIEHSSPRATMTVVARLLPLPEITSAIKLALNYSANFFLVN
jgi:hypothetical protein